MYEILPKHLEKTVLEDFVFLSSVVVFLTIGFNVIEANSNCVVKNQYFPMWLMYIATSENTHKILTQISQ